MLEENTMKKKRDVGGCMEIFLYIPRDNNVIDARRKHHEKKKRCWWLHGNFVIYTSIPVLPFRTRSLSMPQDRHSVFLLPSRSVKNMSWLSFPISKTHWGREIKTSPESVPPYS
jgi:hypothetical protein